MSQQYRLPYDPNPSDVCVSHAGAIALAVFGVVTAGVIIIVVVFLIVNMRNKPHHHDFNPESASSDKSPKIASQTSTSSSESELITRDKYDVQALVEKEMAKEGLGNDQDNLAPLNEEPVTGGLIKILKAKEKEWDPLKNLPDPMNPSKKPANSLGATMGPSDLEISANLPTQKDILEASKQTGPKYVRRVSQIKRSNDFTPIMIPSSYNDGVKRTNMPRITEKNFSDAIAADKKFFGENRKILHLA